MSRIVEGLLEAATALGRLGAGARGNRIHSSVEHGVSRMDACRFS
ncbi:hypothetical protein [Sphingomonas piscis]|nr:hypothetical protein [Sphingomonas piscis]